MKFKPNVIAPRSLIHPELWRAMEITDALYQAVTGDQVTITSVLDGLHSSNSLHYSGLAFDARTRDHAAGKIAALAAALQGILGDWFDVVVESDHLHVEFDPDSLESV